MVSRSSTALDADLAEIAFSIPTGWRHGDDFTRPIYGGSWRRPAGRSRWRWRSPPAARVRMAIMGEIMGVSRKIIGF